MTGDIVVNRREVSVDHGCFLSVCVAVIMLLGNQIKHFRPLLLRNQTISGAAGLVKCAGYSARSSCNSQDYVVQQMPPQTEEQL